MRPGGVIIPIPLEDGPGTWSCGAAVWGKIIGKPTVKDENTKKGTRKRLELLVRTVNTRGENGKRQRGRFQRIFVTSESVFYWILNAAEQGDTFLLFGEYQEREYYARERHKRKDGTPYYERGSEKILKISRDFMVQFAIPAQLVVDPVSYLQRFSVSADEHYGYTDPDLAVTDEDDAEGPGMDDWVGV